MVAKWVAVAARKWQKDNHLSFVNWSASQLCLRKKKKQKKNLTNIVKRRWSESIEKHQQTENNLSNW